MQPLATLVTLISLLNSKQRGKSVFLFPQFLSKDLGKIFAGNARVLECLYRSVRLDAVSLAVVCHYPVATAGNSWKLGA